MKRLLFVIFTFAAIFDANGAILPDEIRSDVDTVRKITGFALNNPVRDIDNSSKQKGLNSYTFDGGKFVFHSRQNCLFHYSAMRLFDGKLKVTQRFAASTANKSCEFIGLNVLHCSSDTKYDLLAFRKSVSRKEPGVWVVQIDSVFSEGEKLVTEFCSAVFKTVPTFR